MVSPYLKSPYLKIAGLCVLVVALGIGAYFTYAFVRYKNDIEILRAQAYPLDLGRIPDGSYSGDCDIGFVSAAVRVDVSGGVITAVELTRHKNDRGGKAEVIPGNIVREQRIGVDAVTGATASSKAIQEAVHNALTGKRTIER